MQQLTAFKPKVKSQEWLESSLKQPQNGAANYNLENPKLKDKEQLEISIKQAQMAAANYSLETWS